MMPRPDREAIAIDIRPSFEEEMADGGISEEDWDFYWPGFLDEYIATIRYDTQD